MSEEMRILREFVEEFSPLHRGETKDMTYDMLFDVVSDIVDSHYECTYDEIDEQEMF